MWGLNALATAGQGFLEKLDDALETAVDGGGSGTEDSDNENSADGDDGDGGGNGGDGSTRDGGVSSADEEETDGGVLVGDELEGEGEGENKDTGGEGNHNEARRTSIEDLAKKVAVLRAARDAEIARNKKLKKESSARVAAAEAAAAEARETAELERSAASDLQRILEATEKDKVREFSLLIY